MGVQGLFIVVFSLELQTQLAVVVVMWHPNPKGPCTQIVYTLGPMYLHREYFKANVYTI